MVLKQDRYGGPGKYQRPETKAMYTWPERLAAAATYIPYMPGFIIGVIYILAKGPNCDRPFFRFHFYQSIFLSVLMFLLQAIGSGMAGVVSGTIRLCEGLIGAGAVSFLVTNLEMVTLVLMAPFILLVPYGMIWALLGRYADIPWVSNVIRSNMAGR